MRFATTLMCFVSCAFPLGMASEPGAKKARPDEQGQRIPPLAMTYEIHVSVDGTFSSEPYIVIMPSGQLFFVPFRSAKDNFPEGTRSTAPGAVDFSYWHAKLASLVRLHERRQGDRLVHFIDSRTHSGSGVYIADTHAAVLQPLFDPFLKPSKTPP